MFNYPLYEKPIIEKSNSSFGNYVIKISDVTFKFFFKKKDAENFLIEYKKQFND
jgi:hypothetical protein